MTRDGDGHDVPSSPPPRPWSVVASVLLVVGCFVLGPVFDGTGARWSAAVQLPGTDVHSGDLDLRVDGADTVGGPSTLSASNLLPGQSVARVVTVSNAGDVPLAYRVDTAVAGSGAAELAGALTVRVTGAPVVAGSGAAATCSGSLLTPVTTGLGSTLLGGSTPRTLAPAAGETVCVELALPLTAPATLLGRSATVRLEVVGRTVRAGSWSDTVPVTGSTLATPVAQAPVLSCGTRGLGLVTVTWTPVPGATAYLVDRGVLGLPALSVPSTTTSQTFVGIAGSASVRAVYGSATWTGPSSNTVTYSALNALATGTCS